MSIAESPKLMTAEEFMALPDDGRERWLHDGQLHINEDSMTARNWVHSEALITIGTYLRNWLVQQPRPRGKFVGGEAGCVLRRNPDILVGVDIAYISAALAAATPRTQAFYDGPPVLAVEILSPSDTLGDILSKTESYLAAGSVVWIVDPYSRIVTVHRPDHPPRPHSIGDELAADPYLPGFRVAVADFFED
ncbi:Uma2 family endonuclease [Tundrisphaera sp. TA3]|uniref:Uma2 family endonuclease n=1 Tax=Tundrisphaera sp. TA3 TaxID=3435775 RepID=UPI003EBFE135